MIIKPTPLGKTSAGKKRLTLRIPQAIIELLELEDVKEYKLSFDMEKGSLTYKKISGGIK